jgi:hypothetical protein
MHILKVSAQVATLSEGFLTVGALERSLACVLSEMVPQIAAFLEYASTVRVFALKV